MRKETNSSYKPWLMLAGLFLIQLLFAFVARSIAPLGLLIGNSFQLTMAQIGMFPAALFLGQSLISIPSGVLTDKIGSRKMIIVITFVLSGSFLLMSVTSSFIILLLLIVIAGFAYGSSHPTTNRGVMSWFTLKRRGTAMGIKQTGVTIGSALAALILLPIANKFGWEFAVVIAALSLLVLGVIIFFIYDEPSSVKDIEASKTTLRKNSFSQVIQLLKHKVLLLITFSAMLLSGSQMILNTFIILYAYEKLGINIILAGVLLGIAEIGGSVGRISWGIISDHVFQGKRIIVLLIISVLVAGISTIFAVLPYGINFYVLSILVFIFGFTVSGFNGVWMNATTEAVDPSQSGIATGISITFGSWGVIFFPPLFGFIVDHTGSYTFGWLFVGFLMTISVILLFITIPLHSKVQS